MNTKTVKTFSKRNLESHEKKFILKTHPGILRKLKIQFKNPSFSFVLMAVIIIE